MRWSVPGCGVVVCAAALAGAAMLARADTVIPWQAAGTYAGDVVTVEGDVAQARLEADTCVLEFDPGNASAFRVVLLIPLITDLPRQPQRLYEGKRVRVTGTIKQWGGRPEMIVRSPSAIEVIGVSAAPEGAAPPPPLPTPTTTPRSPRGAPPTTAPPPSPPPTLAPPAPPAAAPAPPVSTTTVPVPAVAPTPSTIPAPPPPAAVPAPVPAPAAPTTVAPVAPPSPDQEEQAPRLPRAVDPCVTARERWRRAAAAADARAADLTRCLREGSYRCRAPASAMAPALTELEWAEQQVDAACP